MSDETPTTERSDRSTSSQQVQKDVQVVIEHLRSGRTTTSEAKNVRDAATRAIADKAIVRGLR
jgi:hypothetical protein